jgi:hypothetical protein
VITRLALRFTVIYFALYVVCTQMLWALISVPFDIPRAQNLETLPPLRQIITWFAVHAFGANAATLQITPTGSGDKTYDYAEVLAFLAIAAIATIVWSLLARGRESDYVGVKKWFRLFLRFSLGTTMLQYGIVKAFPSQMPAPSLVRLLEPFGDFSPMGVLWASIGASRSYETFAGAMELTAAVLLFIPGLTTFAAMFCFAVVLHVFVLNMTYDVPVKLFSFHLIVMCVVLLAPETKRLLNVLILNRATEPSVEAPLARSRRGQRIWIAAQLLFAAYVITVATFDSMQAWKTRGAGAPMPPLYGMWNVDTMQIDGHTRSPLITDHDRWRRILFPALGRISFQRMDASLVSYSLKTDTTAQTLTLSKQDDKAWSATFTYTQPSPDRLIVNGSIDKRTIQMDLKREDHTTMRLLSRGFHWIQENPFNR